MRRILLAMAVAALMAVMAASSAAAQGPEGAPVGGCPPSYEAGLVPIVVLEGAGLEEPDPSMDPNGDGWPASRFYTRELGNKLLGTITTPL